MRNNANRSHVLITVSPQDRDLAIDLLSVPADKVLTIPNGVDVEVFQPADMSDDQRLSNWKEWLVTNPQGWMADARPRGRSSWPRHPTKNTSSMACRFTIS